MMADRFPSKGRQRAAVKPSSEGQRLLLELPGTVRELAARAGVSPASLSEWQRGVATPSDAHAAKLAGALGIPVLEWRRPPQVTEKDLRTALAGVIDAMVDLDERVSELRSLIEPGWDQ